MKNLIIILICFFSITYSNAQLGISAGLRIGFISSKSFGEFKNSYNDYLSEELSSKLNQIGFGHGLGFGLDYTVGGYFASFRYGVSSGSALAKAKDGGKRHFDFGQSLYMVTCGISNFDESVFYSFAVGIAVGGERIKSYYEYPDGTKSYGTEKLLNGIFDGIHFGPVIQVQYGVPVGDVAYVFGIGEIHIASFDNRACLYDDHYHKQQDPFSDAPEGLPTDYEGYLNDLGTTDYPAENYVASDFNGLRIEIGIRFRIGEGL